MRNIHETTALGAYEPAPDELRDRVILITGAGDGIGKAVSLACARYGATLILLGRTVKKLEAVYDAIVEQGAPQPAIYPLDLQGATPEHYEQLADNVANEFQRLDGLLHNAARLGPLTPMEHFEAEEWAKVFQVNVHAPFVLTRACLPLLKSSKDACIVFTAAEQGRRGRAFWGAYAASKAAAEAMMEVLADEHESTPGLRINSIDPGPTRTRLRSAAYPAENPDNLKMPEDVADRYVYLLGPGSAGVNGVRFVIGDLERKLP
jgi:NAD(P)-dependent dehydrogenase (short-subunit alcohol dehydrogenase family)